VPQSTAPLRTPDVQVLYIYYPKGNSN
jgi:hypothetical protein